MKRGEMKQVEPRNNQDLERRRSYGAAQSLYWSFLIDGFVIYRDLQQDPVVGALRSLLRSLAENKLDLREVYQTYHQFCAQATAYNWPAYLWDRVLESENVFSSQAGFKAWESMDAGLRELVFHDLQALRSLSDLDPHDLQSMVCERVINETAVNARAEAEWLARPEQWPVWVPQAAAMQPDSSRAGQFLETTRNHLKEVLRTGKIEEVGRELAAFYRNIGTGLMATGLAFKWDAIRKTLVAVMPDPIRKEQLIDQEREQGILLENTNFFLAGYPANNVILYGNRGTGKSSLVKALLQEYCDRGLRLVELSKQDWVDFPLLVRSLASQPKKFILFIDDLSFEETELAYKALKTVLEGGLEKRPDNVLIYATSNRRHLIRENFSERQGDEVNVRDTLEEKLSLADRFGITITFPSPDQEEYLRIVEELASQEGLQIEKTAMRQQALRWVMMHNARSGRTARQFIDYLAAQQKLQLQP